MRGGVCRKVAVVLALSTLLLVAGPVPFAGAATDTAYVSHSFACPSITGNTSPNAANNCTGTPIIGTTGSWVFATHYNTGANSGSTAPVLLNGATAGYLSVENYDVCFSRRSMSNNVYVYARLNTTSLGTQSANHLYSFTESDTGTSVTFTDKGTLAAPSGTSPSNLLWTNGQTTPAQQSDTLRWWFIDRPDTRACSKTDPGVGSNNTTVTQPPAAGNDDTSCPTGFGWLNPFAVGSILRCLFIPSGASVAADLDAERTLFTSNYPFGPVTWAASTAVDAYQSAKYQIDNVGSGLGCSDGPDVPILAGGSTYRFELQWLCVRTSGSLYTMQLWSKRFSAVAIYLGGLFVIWRLVSWAFGAQLSGGGGDEEE